MDMPRQAPAATPSRTTADDRRRGDRHRLDVPATLTGDAPDARPIPAVVTAFSVNGVGLRVAGPLAVGDVYGLSTFDTLLPPGLRVRVRTVRTAPTGDHAVGAEVV